ncbi:MAG: thermonuclease family protein [Anaerolineales bacterium]|nr:thermonuclease family protein [Anaerolineales bacterium]MCB9128044.1 thermonuclease family protein [Ardenticatenales bacterium]
MKRFFFALLLVILTVALLVLCWAASVGRLALPEAMPWPFATVTLPADYPARPADLPRADVVRVVDGDTVVVTVDGAEARVRLLGINAPETRDPRRPVQCFGFQSSEAAKALMAGERVWLEADPSQSNYDRYDRLLRYLWLDDGRMVNLELISLGVASEYTYDGPYRYQDTFTQAEAVARRGEVGLWSPATCKGRFDSAVVPTPSP